MRLDIPDWNRPSLGACTVCIIPYDRDGKTCYVRGVAICNPLDQFNKRVGRDIALGRAIKALTRGHDSEPLHQRSAANIVWHCRGMSLLSIFNAALSEFEQRLMRIKTE